MATADRPDAPTAPAATGLSARPTALVALGVERVVEPADRQLAGEHRRGDQQHAGTVCPVVTASAVTISVTATVGSG